MRHLYRLLVLALVPVLIVSVPNVAQAATVHGNPSTVNFANGGLSGMRVECNVVGYWAVPDSGSPWVQAKGDCSVAWMAEMERVYIESLTLHGDGGCSRSVDMTGLDPETAWSVTIGGWDQPCNVTSGVMRICGDNFGDGEDPCGDHTRDWIIVPPAQTTGTCEYGSVAPPTLAPTTADGNGRTFDALGMSVTNPAAGSIPGKWFYYTVRSADFTQGSVTGYDGFLESNTVRVFPETASAVRRFHTRDFSVRPMTGHTFSTTIQTGSRTDRPQVWKWPVVGVGVVYQPAVTAAKGYGESNVADGTARLPQENLTGNAMLAGVTDPSLCAFYWGAKVAETPDDLTDEPMGDLNEQGGTPEPPADEPVKPGDDAGCTFKLTDPTTWLEAGMCAAVGLLAEIWKTLQAVAGFLGSILSAIGDLAQSIIDGILDGLRALFVPAEGFMDGKAQQAQDAWADTAPGVYVGALEDVGAALMIDSPGGGCTGPSLTFPTPIAGGTTTIHPMEACDGGTAMLATIARATLTAAVYIGALLVCVRLLAASIGVQMNLGRSGGDEA